MPNPVLAAAPGLSVTLHEIQDSLLLALDASENRRG